MASGSSLYAGTMWHERTEPFRRRFGARLWFVYLDLDELDHVMGGHRLLSEQRWRPVQFRRSDYLGDPLQSLSESVRDLVLARTGERPEGSIHLLAHLRTWGWCFNPLAVYYCTDRAGNLRWVVADVTNTPWHERHAYVLPAGPDGVREHVEDKMLHVSPFWPMEQRYRFTVSVPSDELVVRIDNLVGCSSEGGGERVVHRAGFHMKRHDLSDDTLRRFLFRYPLLTHRVTLGIHRHALQLKARGATFYRHPNKRAAEARR